MARQFGIITNTSGGVTDVVINSCEKSGSVEVAEARDEQGKVTDRKAYSKQTSYNIRGLLNASGASIEAGDVITFGGVSYLVTNATQTESNTAYVEYAITADTADSATNEAYA